MMKNPWQSNRGAVGVWVALSLPVLLGFSALAIDTSHLLVARNEVQGAADAAALAGARFLYTENGKSVNPNVNQVAYDAATSNSSPSSPLDIHWTSGNSGDIQRGHWSFATRTFTPNDSLQPVPLWDVSASSLDANTNFINAVRIVARRSNPQALALLGRMSGVSGFEVKAEAIAHIGFSGNLLPEEMDAPIAVCEQALLKNGKYSCSAGRYMSMGRNVWYREAGGWTDFDQDNPCTSSISSLELKNLICAGGNPNYIELGKSMATKSDDSATAFTKLLSCWQSNSSNRTKPWSVTLPVIDCDDNNIGRCEQVVGAVTIKILWITGSSDDYDYSEAPKRMGNWSNYNWNGRVRWESFVEHFHLKPVQVAETFFPWTSIAWACHDETDVPYEKKTIYFVPDCSHHQPTGTGGGKNFGMLAKIPTLVK